MKKVHVLIISALALLACATANGQSEKWATRDIWVAGCCAECADGIERAMDIPGVRKASYDLGTHTLHVVYSPKRTTEELIHETLNAVGYDTERSICSDAEYGQMDSCCRYREKGVVFKQ